MRSVPDDVSAFSPREFSCLSFSFLWPWSKPSDDHRPPMNYFSRKQRPTEFFRPKFSITFRSSLLTLQLLPNYSLEALTRKPRPWQLRQLRQLGHEEVISFGSILFSAVASDFRKVSCIIVFGFKLKCESFEMRKVWRVIALWEAEMTWELEH